MAEILKLKLDVVFKSMFADAKNEKTLRNFLAAVLDVPKESIKNIIMSNTELLPESIEDKQSILDLNMKIDDRLVNVEIQIADPKNFPERTLFYWSKLYCGSLPKSKNYKELPETICINIINFNMFEFEGFHSCFRVMEQNRHEILTDKMEIHFFELKKLSKKLDKNNMLELWLKLINSETEEELEMLENTNVQEIHDAIVILKELSADEKTRHMALRREMAFNDQMNAYAAYKKEGIEEGRKEGRKEGREETLIEALEKMIESGIEEEKAKKILGL